MLNFDIEVQCIVQWVLLWYSAPSSLNIELNSKLTNCADFVRKQGVRSSEVVLRRSRCWKSEVDEDVKLEWRVANL